MFDLNVSFVVFGGCQEMEEKSKINRKTFSKRLIIVWRTSFLCLVSVRRLVNDADVDDQDISSEQTPSTSRAGSDIIYSPTWKTVESFLLPARLFRYSQRVASNSKSKPRKWVPYFVCLSARLRCLSGPSTGLIARHGEWKLSGLKPAKPKKKKVRIETRLTKLTLNHFRFWYCKLKSAPLLRCLIETSTSRRQSLVICAFIALFKRFLSLSLARSLRFNKK